MIFENNRRICELFAEQVKKTPGRIALSDSHYHLSYGELNRRSNRIAAQLQSYHNISRPVKLPRWTVFPLGNASWRSLAS